MVPCALIQFYHVTKLNTRTLNDSARSTLEINFQTGYIFYRFKSTFQISKLVFRFQINSNAFSRHKRFQHYSRLPKNEIFTKRTTAGETSLKDFSVNKHKLGILWIYV